MPSGYIPRSRIAGLSGNSVECFSGFLGESVRVGMVAGMWHLACQLGDAKKWAFHFLLSYSSSHPTFSLFFTYFLPKLMWLYGGQWGWVGGSRLRCYLRSPGDWEDRYPEFNSLCGEEVGNEYRRSRKFSRPFCWSRYQPRVHKRGRSWWHTKGRSLHF